MIEIMTFRGVDISLNTKSGLFECEINKVPYKHKTLKGLQEKIIGNSIYIKYLFYFITPNYEEVEEIKIISMESLGDGYFNVNFIHEDNCYKGCLSYNSNLNSIGITGVELVQRKNEQILNYQTLIDLICDNGEMLNKDIIINYIESNRNYISAVKQANYDLIKILRS